MRAGAAQAKVWRWASAGQWGFAGEEAPGLGEGQVTAGQVRLLVPKPLPLPPTPKAAPVQTPTQAVSAG